MKQATLKFLQVLERRWYVVLAVGALVAAGMIWLLGVMQSVWFDEAYSLLVASKPTPEAIALAAADVHPPLYYLILKGWIALWGDGEVALRALGALIGGLIVVAGGVLTKRLFGARALLFALPFLVLGPMLLRYGFELRMYALAVLIGLIATHVLVNAVEKRRRSWWLWAIYAVLVALSMYVVYYIALLWIAHLVWLLATTLKGKKAIWRQPWLWAYAGAAVLFIPWLPSFFSQLTNGALANISGAMTVENLIGVVSFGLLYRPTWELAAWGGIVITAIIASLVWLGLQARRAATKVQRRYLLLVGLYILVPIAVVALVSLAKPLYVERYLVPVIAGAYIAIGALLAFAAQRSPRGTAITGGILGLVLIAGVVQLFTVGNYNFQRLQRPDVKAAVQSIGDCHKGVILAADPYVATELSYYLDPSCEMHFYDLSTTLGGGYAPWSESDLQISSIDVLKGNDTIWYVHYGDPAFLLPKGYDVGPHGIFNGLNVDTWRAHED